MNASLWDWRIFWNAAVLASRLPYALGLQASRFRLAYPLRFSTITFRVGCLYPQPRGAPPLSRREIILDRVLTAPLKSIPLCDCTFLLSLLKPDAGTRHPLALAVILSPARASQFVASLCEPPGRFASASVDASVP